MAVCHRLDFMPADELGSYLRILDALFLDTYMMHPTLLLSKEPHVPSRMYAVYLLLALHPRDVCTQHVQEVLCPRSHVNIVRFPHNDELIQPHGLPNARLSV